MGEGRLLERASVEMGVLAFKRACAEWSEGDRPLGDELGLY